MTQYVGLDVSLKRTAVCVVDETGGLTAKSKVASEPEALGGWLREHAPAARRIGMETGRSQLALEVRRARGLGGQAPEGARGGEPQAQEAAGRADAGRGDAARDAGKRLLTPSSRRHAVTWAIEQKDYSQRRACRLVGLAPKTYRYRSRYD